MSTTPNLNGPVLSVVRAEHCWRIRTAFAFSKGQKSGAASRSFTALVVAPVGGGRPGIYNISKHAVLGSRKTRKTLDGCHVVPISALTWCAHGYDYCTSWFSCLCVDDIRSPQDLARASTGEMNQAIPNLGLNDLFTPYNTQHYHLCVPNQAPHAYKRFLSSTQSDCDDHQQPSSQTSSRHPV